MVNINNVIIIGGGPAGLAAAIYLARANLKPLVFAGSPPGGQLTLTSEVENYPGFESILGAELIQKMRDQAVKLGARVIDENINTIDLSKLPFTVGYGLSVPDQAGKKAPRQTKAVIIATGAKALWLNVPGEERLRGKGVSACATCDGFFFRGKTVAVAGGGDTAMEEALTLTKFAKHVIIIHRKPSFRASKIMQERVLNHPNIHELFNAQVTEVNGETKLSSVTVKITPSDQSLMKKSIKGLEAVAPKLLQLTIQKKEGNSIIGTIPLDGLFVAIGHRPDTDLLAGQVERDERGYVVTTQRKAWEWAKTKDKTEENDKQRNNVTIKQLDFHFQTMTSQAGVFAAGDCADPVYRQAATAVGTGVAAALDAEKWLEIGGDNDVFG
ncbi:FAD-dependent oxidoreductase, partial [Patescibacteria group bacterium]|nr:FAD-dependent oxidoreductase [Patescibacteria group bacterium]